jgi:ankyrin repeat protein
MLLIFTAYIFSSISLPPQNDCNVNGQSYSGNTALHSACGRGQVDTARLLLKNRADSSVKNYHNDTPAMVAKNKKVREENECTGSMEEGRFPPSISQ